MFSSIVYSVLLAFALSDIGGGGLAVAEKKPEERASSQSCTDELDKCKEQGTGHVCSIAKARADCLLGKKAQLVPSPCGEGTFTEYLSMYQGKEMLTVPSEACVCCKDAYEAVKGFKGKLYKSGTADECGAPGNPADICMQCKVKNNTLNKCFKDKDTCENLLEAIECAKTQIQGGEAKCSEGDLKNYIKAQKFVIKDAAQCHTDQCNDLDQVLGNYTLTVMVQSNGNVTECPVGDAAFRIGSALAPVLGALGIVLITFKIL